MEIALNASELINLYLKEFIHEPFIRHLIINYKCHMEQQDNMRYHHERWSSVAGAFFYSKDNQLPSYRDTILGHHGRIPRPSTYSASCSHILLSSSRNPLYIVIPDSQRDFYNITNRSFQSWNFIFDLIYTYHTYGKHYTERHDALLSNLSHKLHLQMIYT